MKYPLNYFLNDLFGTNCFFPHFLGFHSGGQGGATILPPSLLFMLLLLLPWFEGFGGFGAFDGFGGLKKKFFLSNDEKSYLWSFAWFWRFWLGRLIVGMTSKAEMMSCSSNSILRFECFSEPESQKKGLKLFDFFSSLINYFTGISLILFV